MSLFLHCFSRGHESLKVEVLHILSDILMAHGIDILSEETIKPESIMSMWTKALKSEDEHEVAAAAAESLAKLMLASVLTEDEMLKELVETYFNPSSAENNPLKQALSYFFPVYCHSVPENQYRMARVTPVDVPWLIIGCRLGNSFHAPCGGGFRGGRRNGVSVANSNAINRLDGPSTTSRSEQVEHGSRSTRRRYINEKSEYPCRSRDLDNDADEKRFK